jgi:hypothetical protein
VRQSLAAWAGVGSMEFVEARQYHRAKDPVMCALIDTTARLALRYSIFLLALTAVEIAGAAAGC